MANTLSVMTNVLRNVVSKQRIRYKENGYNLDLAYICDNIIAMGYPADNIESIFRNRLEDVYKFLQEIHQDHYKIYNLCLERSYDSNKFHGRVAVYPFEDHNPPTIEMIQRFCTDVDAWLKADNQNVAAVHCKAGKGRTGTMICCYLLYSGQQQTADEALECYAEKRTKDRKGVTIPSQRRYVKYFAKLIRSGVPYEKRVLQFCEIRFTEANLLHSHGTVNCSISVLEDNETSVKVMPLLGTPIDFRKSYTLDLKNHSLCVAGDIKVELAHKKKLFHFWFNTYFVRDDAVIEQDGEEAKLVYTLNKYEIDDAHKDKEHKCFSEGFKVQLVFYAENSMRPGLQPNVSTIISNNQRKSQNARQNSGGGGDSSSSSNCQLPQNSSSGSDLNYICDQKSTSSASASVSSLGGPLVGSGGSGSFGDTSIGEVVNANFSGIEANYAGSQFMQLPQQQLKQRISVNSKQQHSVGQNISSVVATQQHTQPQHTYVNLEHIMPATDKQHLQLIQQQQHQQQQHQLMKSLLTSTPNHTMATITPTLATAMATSTASNSFMLALQEQQQQQQQQQQKSNTKFVPPTAASGFMSGNNILSHKTAHQLDATNMNNYCNSMQLDRGNTTTTITAAAATTTMTTAQSNGTVGSSGVGGGREANGCLSGGNSSKSSISSQSSSAASSTSSSSSAPTSAGDQDCEEEDWESGECHPKMSHTIAQKALQSHTLLVPSKSSTANSTITFSDFATLPNTTTTNLPPTAIHTTIPFTTTTTSTTHPKMISNPISQLPSTFYMNINSDSGSCNCSYCCCDDDEIKTNLKSECEHVQKTEKLQEIKKLINNERRSSYTAAKSNGRIENAVRPLEVENRNAIAPTVNMYYENLPQYRQLVPSDDKTSLIQVSQMVSPTKKGMVNVSNVVNSWTNKAIFQNKIGSRKMREIQECMPISPAIMVTKSNAYGTSSTTSAAAAAADAAMLALSCSPATSGCSGLASTSRLKLKNKLKNNTKKLSHWLQNHFRANPVEFCENVVQHTTAMRRNSNCSLGSRNHKLSMSSVSLTVTPGSSLPKRHYLTPSATLISEKCIVDNNESMDGETYDIYDENDEVNAVGGHGRTKISLSESTSASNGSLSTVGGGGGGHGGSSDAFEDFYSSNCDNQLSFNNSPCKSPRSLVDIAGSSAYSVSHENVYGTSLTERNTHFQIKRELYMQRMASALPPERQQHHHLHHHHHHPQQLHQLNVVVVAAKPAKTHAIGFNICNNESTHVNDIEKENADKDAPGTTHFNNLHASDMMTTGADVNFVSRAMSEEEVYEKLVEQRDGVVNKLQISSNGGDMMLDTKIDEVDEDADSDDEGIATTASSIYYTPLSTSGAGVEEIDGINTRNEPFKFPNMQDELAKITAGVCREVVTANHSDSKVNADPDSSEELSAPMQQSAVTVLSTNPSDACDIADTTHNAKR